MSFVHLHVHGEKSIKDAMCKHEELTKAAKGMGMSAIALTDHGALFGVVGFYRAAVDAGIKPIIGCETYVAPRENTYKNQHDGDAANHHLVLLCENNKGYQNLVEIISDAAVHGFYYKARTDKAQLRRFSEGLIALSACVGGEVAQCLSRGGEQSYELAKAVALEYDAIFGRGNFFLELQNHGLEGQVGLNQSLLRISTETGIPVVATNDVHYIGKHEAAPHDVLMAMQAGKTIYDSDRKKYPTDQYYLKSVEEMYELFQDIPDAIENTTRIADRCNVSFDFTQSRMPTFNKVPPWQTNSEYLRELTLRGVAAKYSPEDLGRIVKRLGLAGVDEAQQVVERRVDYELSVIQKMGFDDYFLIVWDLLRYYREELNGPLSPGRGSAVGSLVAYALGITLVEPIWLGLLFERFLSPDRITRPDIDIDFCVSLRKNVIDYVVTQYGEDSIVQIITFGTYAARAAIRAVGKALSLPYTFCDKVAKMVPEQIGVTLREALVISQDLKSLYEANDDARLLIDFAISIEGLPAHTSTHAAGVLICPGRTIDYVPLWVNDGVSVAQFDMNELDSLGLLKMDFLGLRNLTVIQTAVNNIYANTGRYISREELLASIHEPTSYTMIQKGLTEGIFQLEGSGMTSFMHRFKPKFFEEVIAGLALYRPGPMDYIPRYLENREFPERVQYFHPGLAKHLAETNGVITYQEQCMFIVADLAGYSMSDADDFRRAISKKKEKEIAKHRSWFINGTKAVVDASGQISKPAIPGCVRNGIEEDVASRIFDEMQEFGKYAFNKSHSAGYAVLVCETSWLKQHYPVEFMAALMTSIATLGSHGDPLKKIASYISHCKRDLGINVFPPDINISTDSFVAATDGTIRFALTAVKNVGKAVSAKIVQERKDGGKFRSLTDFIRRVPEANRQCLESLIKCGAFDTTGAKRSQLMAVLDKTIGVVDKRRGKLCDGQWGIFQPAEVIVDVVPNIDEYPPKVFLQVEKDTLGVYVSGHPLDRVRAYAEKHSSMRTCDFAIDINALGELVAPIYDRQPIELVCVVTDVQKIFTKSNELMAFVTVEDMYGSAEVIFFPRLYAARKDIVVEDAIIRVKGVISTKDDAAKILAEDVQVVPEDAICQIVVHINTQADLPKIAQCLRENSGDIVVQLRHHNQVVTLPSQFWTNQQAVEILGKQYNILVEGGNSNGN